MPVIDATQRERLSHAILDLVADASGAVMDVYSSSFAVETKSDASPVTEADQRAEDIILAGLSRIAPDIGVISEEAHSRGESRATGDTFFLVDPLDGTREFVSRNGEFTVNVALIDAGVPVLGVIAAPARERVFAGWAPGKAFEAGTDGQLRPISVRACPQAGPIAVASRSHRDAETDAYLSALGASDTRSAGSSLKFCLVAAGEADIYPRFGPTCEWDIAAGHAILAAAGGGVACLDGSPFKYGKRDRDYLNPGFIAWGGGAPPPMPEQAGT